MTENENSPSFFIYNLIFIYSAELLHYFSLAEFLALSANYLVGLVSLAREKNYISLARVLKRVKDRLSSVGNSDIRTAVCRELGRSLSDNCAGRLVIGVVRGEDTEVRIS